MKQHQLLGKPLKDKWTWQLLKSISSASKHGTFIKMFFVDEGMSYSNFSKLLAETVQNYTNEGFSWINYALKRF